MRRFYQAVVDIIRGGVHPREVALAVALGLLAGFVSGWNLCLAVVLLAVLILNVPTKVFGEAWALGWAASWSLTPASFALGRWLLENSPLGSMLAAWRDHPLLVLFDLDRYTVLGGGALAVMIMLPAAWLAARITLLLQSKFQEIHAALEAKTELHGSLIVRLGCWLIFGDAAKPVPAPAVNPDWVRRRGMLLALGVFVPAGVLGCFFAPGLATDSLLTALSTANQSEVNAGQMRLSFGDGLLEIDDLQVSDPDHPDRDRLRIGYVAAQLRPGPLLRGRLHIERLMLENIEPDVARQNRARPCGVRLPKLDATAIKDLVPDVKFDGPESINLEEYLSNWETIRERLRRLEEMLTRINELSGRVPTSEDEPEYDPTQDVPASYLAMREARHGFGRATPKLWIEVAALKGLASQFGLGSDGSVELANLSSQPALTGQPTVVAIKAPGHGAEIVATLNLHQPEASHELKFHASGIDLAGLIEPYSPRAPLSVRGGKISLVGRGWLTPQEFELAINAELADLRVQVSAQRPVAGLPPQLWNDGLAQLRGLQTEATLAGRWSKPQLRIDSDRLVQQFKQQLLAAGETLLAKAIDEQIARGEARVGQAIDQSLARAEAAVDRQAAKVDAAVDRTTERAEQIVDRASTKIEGVVAKGEAQVAGVGQRVEHSAAGVQSTLDRTQSRVSQTQDRYAQSAAQAQQTAQQWQNQLGAASRILQDNMAASSLTSLGPAQGDPSQLQGNAGQPGAPSPLPPTVEQDIAAEIRRRGPPPLQYGDIVGAASAEQPAPLAAAAGNPVAPPGQPLPATPPSDGMRYPESVRNFAVQAPPAVAPRTEVSPSPIETRAAPDANTANRPASFNGPPASMELGYEARRPLAQPSAGAASTERSADRRNAAGANSTPTMIGRVTPRDPATGSRANAAAGKSQTAAAPEASAKPEGVKARLGNWSRGVTGKVKGLNPWSRGAEATASDEGIAPEGQVGPPESTETAAAPQLEKAPTDTPWYRRMWR